MSKNVIRIGFGREERSSDSLDYKIVQVCNSSVCKGEKRVHIFVDKIDYKNIFAVYRCERCNSRLYVKKEETK